jgi:predicted RNA-binding Zn ribbon-like protein
MSWDAMARVSVAPGRLEVVRQFLNTIDFENSTDELETTRGARRWLGARGLVRRGAQVSERERMRLIELREALRALAWAHTNPPLPRDALTRLNRLASTASIHPMFNDGGNVQLTAVRGDVQDAISALLAIVCESIADESWTRFKVCRDERCRWAFYDASRNQVGTWCSMAFCGNRAKTRAYRQRQRTAS